MKRRTIELVTGVNGDGLETVTYATPIFVSTEVTYEAYDITERIEEQVKFEEGKIDKVEDPLTQRGMFEMLADFTVKLYGDKFTKKELIAGLHAPEALMTLQENLRFVTQGDQSEENTQMTKKFLAKKG
ncbi:phage tail assembly chaperone G [Alkalicoccobacillus gibsonii]|uniref:phage tail assembly chaperone G n=1 Tax=Alkalicoccobacillus gibsonii TaxID=79881 RepID=UPI001AED9A0D|nr:hypothetical protein [Alkalicoccobacillus gibsonii]